MAFQSIANYLGPKHAIAIHSAYSFNRRATTVAMALTAQNRARGAKPGVPTAAAYAITDLGSPLVQKWGLLFQGLGINMPDNQGVMDVIGWD